jgi:putative transposase
MVPDIAGLDRFRYSGHATLLGKKKRPWQDTETVLRYFGEKQTVARQGYRDFVEKGIAQGHRNDLIGGGLIRSYQGWRPSIGEPRVKGDERILGSSTFVLDALTQAEEMWEHRNRLRAQGIDFDAVLQRLAVLFTLTPEEILSPGKYRNRVTARCLLCYFSVRHLGITATALARKTGLSQPAITKSVAKGESIAKQRNLTLVSLMETGGEEAKVIK